MFGLFEKLRFKDTRSSEVLENIDELNKQKEKEYEEVREIMKAIDTNYQIGILAIADCHGMINEDELRRCADEDYDFCVLLGDNTEDDIALVLKYVPVYKVYGLLGNHDSWQLLNKFGIADIHGRTFDLNGVVFAGLSCSCRYKSTPELAMMTDEESVAFVERMDSANVLFSHDKPKIDITGDIAHDGLQGITDYVERCGVLVNIHGHLHKSYDIVNKLGIREICVHGCQIIEI